MSSFKHGTKKMTGSPLAAWIKRRAVVSRLSVLDSRTLEDIGIERYQIEAIAEKVFPKISYKAYASAVLNSIREEMKYLRAARQLVALDDRMLADIGIDRSEIPGALRGELPLRAFSVPSIMHVSRDELVHSISELAPDDIPAPVNDDARLVAA